MKAVIHVKKKDTGHVCIPPTEHPYKKHVELDAYSTNTQKTYYKGNYEVIPIPLVDQVLETDEKFMSSNVVVKGIPYDVTTTTVKSPYLKEGITAIDMHGSRIIGTATISVVDENLTLPSEWNILIG